MYRDGKGVLGYYCIVSRLEMIYYAFIIHIIQRITYITHPVVYMYRVTVKVPRYGKVYRKSLLAFSLEFSRVKYFDFSCEIIGIKKLKRKTI